MKPFIFILCSLFLKPNEWRKKLIDSSIARKGNITFARKLSLDARNRILFWIIIGALALAIGDVYASESESTDSKIFFNIPRERADFAIVKFAEQSNMTYIFPFDEARKIVANRVYGRYTREEAVNILLRGTKLQPEIVSDGSLKIMTLDRIEKKGEEMASKHQSVIVGLITAIGIQVGPTFAQSGNPLEEIIVTAQRREQSLQEVPISIQTISGEEIRRQGFNDLEDLATFSPGVYIKSGLLEQRVTVRGFGTIGNSATLEQAVPIFVDGVHFGRQSQIFTAFLDVDRVEILKGPQPVYFGMNATAGAFNIQSKKPTPEWEGEIEAELGNNGSRELSFGTGGPITDTLGIRVSGIYDYNEGFLNHVITGNDVNEFGHMGGRVILQWAPNEALNISGKIEASRLRNGTEAVVGCVTRGSLVFGRGGASVPGTIGDERSIYAEPPKGSGTNLPITPLNNSGDGKCFKDNDLAVGNGAPHQQMPDNLREENMVFGSIDIREAAANYITSPNNGVVYADSGLGFDSGTENHDNIDSFTSSLAVNYQFQNGIELDLLGAYNGFTRRSVRDDSNSPFFLNHQAREELFNQWSAEARFTSPVGGRIEWMAGVQYQVTAKDDFHNTLRANVRQAQRLSTVWEDASWLNAFATGTLNFLDNRASLDIGARLSHLEKEILLVGYGASWVFDVEPVGHPNAVMVSPEEAKIFVNREVDMANLWTIPFRGSRTVPSEWLPSQTSAVGLVPLSTQVRPEMVSNSDDFYDDISNDYIDPQVTLRYRLGQNSNHSLFARWAQATKGAGYDVGPGALPADYSEFHLGRERGQTWEFGSKGNFWDGRTRYDITFFRTTFSDLQLSGLAPITNQDQSTVAINAGEQRVQGFEYSITSALTTNLTVGFGGAIMDGEMTDFNGSGCNDDEYFNALLGLGIQELAGCDVDSELIDRTGDEAPRTPDWNFVMSTDYSLPIYQDYIISFNAKGFYSDGYITDRSGFSKRVKFNKHGDLNLNMGLSDVNEAWNVIIYANNIFEHRPSYNPQFDTVPDGTEFLEITNTSFSSYGIRFNYNFR